MKLPTAKELDDHRKATIRGGIEGVVGSLAVTLPGYYYAYRRFPYYRALPPSLKALGIVVIVAPCFAIQAERRGVEYDKSTWTGAGMFELEKEAADKEARWESLTTRQKFGEWAADHQYSLILGSWALSMAVAGAYIMRDRHQTTAQKLVQVRMWAQGITIGLIIAGGAMTHSRREEALKHRTEDHSWASLLEQQAREDEELRIKALTTASAPAPA